MTCRLLSLGLLWFLLGVGAPFQVHGESPSSSSAAHHRAGLEEQQEKRLPATPITVSSPLTQSQIYAPIIAFVPVPTPVPPPTPPPSPDQTEEILIPAGEF